MDWSLAVWSGLLWFLDSQGLVSVSVQALERKRLDWTGLSNTILWWEGNDAVNPVVGDPPVADIKGKSRMKLTGKGGSTGPKGRGKEEEQQESSTLAGEVNAEHYAIQMRGYHSTSGGRACSAGRGQDNGRYHTH